MTKRDLVIRISNETGLVQQQVLEVIQKTLDYISAALAQGKKVELRNFGVFEVKVRKARVGRNPHAPETDVPIPQRAVVKFKPGKDMRETVLKLTPEQVEAAPRAQEAEPSDDGRHPPEPLELYTVKSGAEIVGQLYNFTDKGDRAIALRPEMTPTLARMVAACERHYKKPIKWFAIPQLFRYERQQKGRLREHFQFNADIFGETDPAADAELIALLVDSLRALKLTADDFVIRLSSRSAWHEFFNRQARNPELGTQTPELAARREY